MIDNHPSESSSKRLFSINQLSQHTYCPRAGILACESPFEDIGDDSRPIRLGYLPQYSLVEIEKWIARSVGILCVVFGIAALALLVILISYLANSRTYAGYAWAAFAFSFPVGVADLVVLSVLTSRRRSALGTPAREPQFGTEEPAPIHWWELRSAGLVPREPERLVDDELWGIKGRPWAVLVRGSVWIPVLRMMGKSSQLHPNHFVRIAAYCTLIETTTNYESPYGIVLLPNSLEAKAIPNAGQQKRRLEIAVTGIRDLMASRQVPAPPEDEKVCDECFFGKPHRFIENQSETTCDGEMLPPLTVKAYGKYWHSKCGDRFRWHTPPTRKFADLRSTS